MTKIPIKAHIVNQSLNCFQQQLRLIKPGDSFKLGKLQQDHAAKVRTILALHQLVILILDRRNPSQIGPPIGIIELRFAGNRAAFHNYLRYFFSQLLHLLGMGGS